MCVLSPWRIILTDNIFLLETAGGLHWLKCRTHTLSYSHFFGFYTNIKKFANISILFLFFLPFFLFLCSSLSRLLELKKREKSDRSLHKTFLLHAFQFEPVIKIGIELKFPFDCFYFILCHSVHKVLRRYVMFSINVDLVVNCYHNPE